MAVTELSQSLYKCVDKGIPIALYGFGEPMPSRYCCGVAVAQKGSSSLGCAWSPEPFTLESGSLIPGRGILKDYVPAATVAINSTCPMETSSTCPTGMSSNNVVAVGTGIGVSLGLFSITAVSWALWERHRRRKEAAKSQAIQTAMQATVNAQQLEIEETNAFRPQAPGQITELRHDREPAELSHLPYL
ncbi:hypothetical protein HD806DRAFT_533753 [Xylariaceae sp. AK1471]|nr:hypothetical protein HD806DRAFT_533753 [Xylariaceae sp. AK1471]